MNDLYNLKNYTKLNFTERQEIKLTCPICHYILNFCGFCNKPYNLKDRNEVYCSIYINNHTHICKSCYEKLTDGV